MCLTDYFMVSCMRGFVFIQALLVGMQGTTRACLEERFDVRAHMNTSVATMSYSNGALLTASPHPCPGKLKTVPRLEICKSLLLVVLARRLGALAHEGNLCLQGPPQKRRGNPIR